MGLFDYSGQYGDLLNQRQRKQAVSRGLLDFGANMLAAGGPSTTPSSFGADVGRAIGPGMQAYDASAQGAIQSDMLRQKMADDQAARAVAAKQSQARQALQNHFTFGSGTPGGRAMMSQGAPSGAMPRGPIDRNAVTGLLFGAGETKGAIDYATAAPPQAKTIKLAVPGQPDMVQTFVLNRDGTPGAKIGGPESKWQPRAPDKTLVKVPDKNSITGFTYVPRAQATNMPAPAGSSLDITLPDGTKVRSGTNRNFTETGDQPRSVQAIEEEIEGLRDTYANVSMFKDQFRPEWQTIGSRVGTAWTGARAKWGAVIPGIDANIDPAARQELVEFAAYRRNAIGGLNDYIKEITGAQMSEAEAKRITKAFPDVGEGIFDGDDPVSFESKMNEVMVNLELAMARKTHSLREGLDWKGISLPRMRVILREQSQKIRRRLRRENSEATEEEIDTMGRDEFQTRFFGGGAA